MKEGLWEVDSLDSFGESLERLVRGSSARYDRDCDECLVRVVAKRGFSEFAREEVPRVLAGVFVASPDEGGVNDWDEHSARCGGVVVLAVPQVWLLPGAGENLNRGTCESGECVRVVVADQVVV